MFAKVYLEITNVCNLSCSFCHGTSRKKAFMTPEEFETLAKKLVGKTKYLYLHVLGEPLLHPRLGELIDIAGRLGFRVCLTTNGTLLNKCADALLSRAEIIYKISISLHSFEANGGADCEKYVRDCVAFQKSAGAAGIISVMRLWNLDGATEGENSLNGRILDILRSEFPGEWADGRGGQRIGDHCYLEWGERFEWPDANAPDYGEKRFCMGMRDQIGVLCDGTVVPCCLDCEGNIPLGNLFRQDIDGIVHSVRAERILSGFSDGRAVEELCRRCGYSKRFDKKL